MNQPTITEVDVRNYMRVRTARLTLDGNTFVIAGDNGTGKSSFVQAIEDAFGGSKFAPTMPIRKGASEAVILIALTDGSGRVLKAEVVHSKTGRRLVVKDADGKAQASPQAIMDAFWAETSFDPSLFLVSKADKQVEMLKRLAGLDFAALDTQRADKFSARTIIGKEADRLGVLATSKPTFPGVPKEEVSAQAIIDEIDIAKKHNERAGFLTNAANTSRDKLTRYRETVEGLQKDVTGIDAEIARLQERRKELGARISSGFIAIGDEQAGLEKQEKAIADFRAVDVGPLNTKLSALETTNRQVRANGEKAQAVQAAREKQWEYDLLTREIENIDEQKAEALRNAKFPIEGMSIDADEVTIGGIPLAQQSDSQRLAIGVEMAAVMNPGKPLMLIRQGSVFTSHNFATIEEIAKRRNLICIVEIPGKYVANARLVFEDGVGTNPTHEQPVGA